MNTKTSNITLEQFIDAHTTAFGEAVKTGHELIRNEVLTCNGQCGIAYVTSLTRTNSKLGKILKHVGYNKDAFSRKLVKSINVNTQDVEIQEKVHQIYADKMKQLIDVDLFVTSRLL